MNVYCFSLISALAALLLASCAPTVSTASHPAPQQAEGVRCAPLNEADVTALFDRWNAALHTGDPAQVTALYHDDALLLPTVSNRPRANHAEINDYFTEFLKKKPVGKIERRIVRLGCNMAVDGGIYTFNFGKDGSSVTGRYTFLYEFVGGEWKIASHHSSAMPQDIKVEPWSK